MAEKKFNVVSVGDCVMDCLLLLKAALIIKLASFNDNLRKSSYVDRMPKMGETMAANNFVLSPGGKGANACIASARLGSKNAFICKLGNDLFGKNFINILEKENINFDNVTFTDNAPTSVASIMVDNEGRNSIAVNFGATLELNEADLDNAEDLIKNSNVLVTSMVVKGSTALHALKLAKKHNLMTVFNFAPALKDLDPEFNKYVDILIVNEVEAEVFTGSSVQSPEDAQKACKIVLSREGFYIGVVVTLGDKGCVYGDKKTGETQYFPAKKVEVVDSTGAGDAFVGSLAHFVSLLGTNSINKAIELASEYASLTVTRKGTQTSYPDLSSLEEKFRITSI